MIKYYINVSCESTENEILDTIHLFSRATNTEYVRVNSFKECHIIVSDILSREYKTYNTVLVGLVVPNFMCIQMPYCSEEFERDLRQLHISKIHMPHEIIVGNRNPCRVKVADISAIETRGRKIVVCTKGCDYDSYQPLREYQEQLKEWPFIEVHRGVLVNLYHIVRIRQDVITLKDGSRRDISRRKLKCVTDRFKKHVR